MSSQEFYVPDVMRLQIQEGWPDLPNDVLNPNGEGGAWDWYVVASLAGPSSDYVGISATATGDFLTVRAKQNIPIAEGIAAYYGVPIEPVTAAGQQVRAAIDVDLLTAPTGEEFFGVVFTDDDLVDTGPPVSVQIDAAGVVTVPATNIPVGTTYLAFIVGVAGTALSSASAAWRLRFNNAWMIHGDAASVAASDPLTEPAWVDVLGSAASLTVERDELNVGILNALLLDATLDPAETDLIRPGKRVRVEVQVDGEWERIFTGALDDPSTAYVVGDPTVPDLKKVRIQLAASDPVTDLANYPRTEGVGTIAELPYVLLGTGVPFNVNGSTDAIAPDSVTVVADNDQAKAIDQVAITRDSVLGFAWIDRNGVLQVWDADEIATHYPIEIPNGTFDVDVSGWTGSNATLAHVVATPYEGPGALRMTSTLAGVIAARTPIGVDGFRVVPGASYRIEAYNRRAGAAASRTSRVQLRWYDAAGVLLSTTDGAAIANTTDYVLRDVEGVAPADAEFLALGLNVNGTIVGEQHFWDSVTLSGPAAQLDDTMLSDVAADFDISRTFNTLNVELLRINPGTGETESIPFGPYIDPSARREWRAREATFKIQGVDEALIDDYAAAILARNSQPEKRINTASLPIRTVDELEARSLLDLYDLVTVSSVEANVPAQLSRITSVRHRIVIKKEGELLVNRWWIDLGFTSDGSVAAPQVTPSPSVGGGRTIAELLRPVGEVTMWYGAKADCPAGWLVMDGSAFDGAVYPELAALLGGTVLPNMEDRFPIGAGTKALGTSGGSPTVVIGAGNLPPHTHALTRKAAAGTSTGVVRGNGVAETDGVTQDGGFANNPLNVLNPWRSVWYLIRAA